MLIVRHSRIPQWPTTVGTFTCIGTIFESIPTILADIQRRLIRIWIKFGHICRSSGIHFTFIHGWPGYWNTDTRSHSPNNWLAAFVVELSYSICWLHPLYLALHSVAISIQTLPTPICTVGIKHLADQCTVYLCWAIANLYGTKKFETHSQWQCIWRDGSSGTVRLWQVAQSG